MALPKRDVAPSAVLLIASLGLGLLSQLLEGGKCLDFADLCFQAFV